MNLSKGLYSGYSSKEKLKSKYKLIRNIIVLMLIGYLLDLVL